MTERPGRDSRRVQHRVRRVSYLGSRCLDHLLFLVVVTLFAIAAVGHLLSNPLMVTWLAILLPVALLQLGLSKRITAGRRDERAVSGSTEVMLTCLIVIGVTWGLIGLYAISRGGDWEQTLVVALISSLVIYAVTHVSAVFGVFAIYVLVLTTPSAVFLILSSNTPTRTLGAVFIVLIAAGFVGGWRHYQLLSRAVRAELEAEETSAVLNKLKTRLERSEESTS